MQATVRSPTISDIERMVLMSKSKRLSYEKAQPQFWRYAGDNAEESQSRWFKELLIDKDYIILTSENISSKVVIGFIVGKIMSAPEVYNPGGLTLMIDDFCVAADDLWASAGKQLIAGAKQQAKEKGVAQIVVVCGAHDIAKRQFLVSQNLSIASEWFVGGLTSQ